MPTMKLLTQRQANNIYLEKRVKLKKEAFTTGCMSTATGSPLDIWKIVDVIPSDISDLPVDQRVMLSILLDDGTPQDDTQGYSILPDEIAEYV